VLELPGVDRARADGQLITGTDPDDDVGADPRSGLGLHAAAQVADVGVQRATGPGRRPVAPHALGQPFGGHHVAAGDDERGQDRSLAPSTEVDDGSAPDAVELAEHAQFDLAGGCQPVGFVHHRSYRHVRPVGAYGPGNRTQRVTQEARTAGRNHRPADIDPSCVFRAACFAE